MRSRGSRTAGVLSASSNSTQRGSEKTAGENNSVRAPVPALKVVVRRLPPGLTQDEFEKILGDEWKVGGPCVDWYSFKPGKATKGITKPSKPGRAYFHLTDQSKVTVLHEKIKFSQFHDAANTHRDPVLAGPPYLQYAPFSKIPKRNRKDKRQGMIDQDSDFIAFLESLTNPIQKASPDAWMEEPKEEIPVVTPLIQYMKEKKAKQSRSKESPAKAAKQPARELKENKVDKNKKVLTRAEREKEKRDKATGPSTQPPEKPMEKPAKEPAKPAKAGRAPGTPESSAAKDKTVREQKQKEKAPPTAPAADRKKEKGKAILKPQILRREPIAEPSKDAAKPSRAPRETRESREAKPPREPRGAKGKAEEKSKTEKETETAPTTSTATGNVVPPAEPAPKPPKAPRNQREKARERAKAKSEQNLNASTPPTGPKASTASESGTPATQQPPSKPAAATTSRPSTASGKQSAQTPPPAQQATQAFLKHANPSQGVTEENLFSGFSVFGQVLKTEIDKKKGFGYVYFADPDGLKKAIQASPVQIAESKVVVLDRKTAPQISMARGRGNMSRGGGGQQQQQQAQQAQAPPAQPQSQTPSNQNQPQAAPSPALSATSASASQGQKNQPSKQPPTAPAADRAASSGNGKAPPTGPRGGRPRHHRGPRGGNRGGNKTGGNTGGSSAAAPVAPSGSAAQ
ncbi:hypothetical protein KEM56_004489 [Ascosphaera pollenicola]|nr:hypothetical protein KEM56_004489 [Ascosphaera pollenicola]